MAAEKARTPASPSGVAAPIAWEVFRRQPGLVLGFHGCDRDTAEAVLASPGEHLKRSENRYDWLGSGIYFWEHDPWRALAFACDARERRFLTKGRVRRPYVVGAVIDLGTCCNLLQASSLRDLRRAYDYMEAASAITGQPLPANRGPERGLRFLDMAVVETMHRLRARRGLPPFDSVRAAFQEGEPLYASAGFHSRNHVQIAVRDPSRILAYFRAPGL